MSIVQGLAALLLFLFSANPASAQIQLISPTGKPWRYSADNTDQYAAGFPNVDDSMWPEGMPLFGNDTNVNYRYPFVTRVPAPNEGVETSYYSTHFLWNGPNAGMTLWLTNMVDDGVVVYLNGSEIVRWNISAPAFGPVTHGTRAVANVLEPSIVVHQVSLDSLTNALPNPLRSGDNVLAVSLHQASLSSSDAVFGLSVHVGEIPPCPAPVVTPGATNALACRKVTFRATVEAFCNLGATLQWFRNVGSGDEAIVGATLPDLVLSDLTLGDSGQYFVRAIHLQGTRESARSTLTVLPDTVGPRYFSALAEPPNRILVTFDEPVLPLALGGSVDDPATWQIEMGFGQVGPALNVVGAIAESDFTRVRLTLDADIPLGAWYLLSTTQPIADACAGAVSAAGLRAYLIGPSEILHWRDGRPWRFHQPVASLGTAWKERDFDDSAWSIGTQGFGNELFNFPDAPDSLRTPLMVSGGRMTYYFRTRFWVPNLLHSPRLFAAVDDGAVFYLNGNEIGRINVPPGPVNFNTLVPPITEGQGYLPVEEVGGGVSGSLIVGENTLAIEVHQAADSSDILLLTYLGPTGDPMPPTIDSQPASVAVVEGRTFTLSVAASPAEVRYQWTKDGLAIPGATSAVYTNVAQPGVEGVYRVLVSGLVGSVLSEPATVYVRRIVMPYQSNWRYNYFCWPGAAWSAPGFDDSQWLAGPGLIGYETTVATVNRIPPIHTMLPYLLTADVFVMDVSTLLCRATVTVPELSPGEGLYLSHVVDDGAAFYFDGVLSVVYNISTAPPYGCFTFAADRTPGDGDAREVTVPIALAPGTHSIAVEVHPNFLPSADVVFGAEITRGPALPVLHLEYDSPISVRVFWTPKVGIRLYSAPTADGIFLPVAGNPQGEFRVTVTEGERAQFFRLGL